MPLETRTFSLFLFLSCTVNVPRISNMRLESVDERSATVAWDMNDVDSSFAEVSYYSVVMVNTEINSTADEFASLSNNKRFCKQYVDK